MFDPGRAFRRRKLKKDRLASFGFTEQNGAWHYSEDFMDGDFRADVDIDAAGKVSSRVIDLNDGGEYLPVTVGVQTGSFVGSVREAYADILEKIAENCFSKVPFVHDQSNRIAGVIKQRYGEVPDYPFKKLPNCGVFRFPGNRKWYALIMEISKKQLTKKKADKDTYVEVMNVKADPAGIDELLSEDGIYPSYHMNKKSWVSIVLDGTVPDERIADLIDRSRQFAVGSGKAACPGVPAVWIVPANPSYYDIVSAFEKKKGVIWKQGKGIRKGDTVYMYVGAPISAVLYRCVVTRTDIPYEFADKNVRMTHLMEMDVLETFDKGKCPFPKLGELGIKAVRGPRRVTAEFLEYMKS